MRPKRILKIPPDLIIEIISENNTAWEFTDKVKDYLSIGVERIILARALVMRPRILLMDEPLSNLDPDLNLRMRKEILRLQEDLGITLLYVTHDRDEAFSLATRIVVMEHGGIRKTGNVEEISRYLSELSPWQRET